MIYFAVQVHRSHVLNCKKISGYSVSIRIDRRIHSRSSSSVHDAHTEECGVGSEGYVESTFINYLKL